MTERVGRHKRGFWCMNTGKGMKFSMVNKKLNYIRTWGFCYRNVLKCHQGTLSLGNR